MAGKSRRALCFARWHGESEPCRARNLQYNLWRDRAGLGRFVIEERYLDDAAAAVHRASPHYKSYLSRVNDLAERTALVLDPFDVACKSVIKQA